MPGSSNANEAIQISIVQPGAESPKAISTFHPQFTYSVFGDEERIFGYQGLAIKLRFAAHDLYPHVSVSSNAEFKTVGDTKATDVVAVLEEHLPSCERYASNWKWSYTDSRGEQMPSGNPPASKPASRRAHLQTLSTLPDNLLRATAVKAATLRSGAEN